MSDLFMIPLLAAALAMLFSHGCMSGERIPFAGLFTFVLGFMAFAAVFAVMLIYTILKAIL